MSTQHSLGELSPASFPELAASRKEYGRQRAATPMDGQVEADLRQPHSMSEIVCHSGGFGKEGTLIGLDFVHASPLPLDWGQNPRKDACALLSALFHPDEYVFAAWKEKSRGLLDRTVRTRREWEEFLLVCPHRCAVSASLARLAGGKRSLVTKKYCLTHAAETIPPLVQQGLWYVRPELVVGGDS